MKTLSYDEQISLAVREINSAMLCGFDAIEQFLARDTIEADIVAAVRKGLDRKMQTIWDLAIVKGRP